MKTKKIEELIPNQKKNQKVIDLGCEYGDLTAHLKSLGYDIIGIDINQENITIARERHKDVDFLCKDVWDISFKEYDIIISYGLFEYIWNFEKLLDKLYFNMKKGSCLIFTVPNVSSLSKRIRSILGYNPNRETIPSRIFTFEDIDRIIKETKFENREIHDLGIDSIRNINYYTTRNLSSIIIVKLVK